MNINREPRAVSQHFVDSHFSYHLQAWGVVVVTPAGITVKRAWCMIDLD